MRSGGIKLILALLVGFNLTLMCQGHDQNGHHVSPHLMLLDVFGHDHAGEQTAARLHSATDLGQPEPEEHQHHAAVAAQPVGPWLQIDPCIVPAEPSFFSPNIAQTAFSEAPTSSAFSSAGLVALLLLFFTPPGLRSSSIFDAARARSLVVLAPKPPPPR